MNDFLEEETESLPSQGENPLSDDGADVRQANILAKAREIATRKPTAADLEETAARRKRNAAVEAIPDLATLQKEWLIGSHMSDQRFYEMRRLETLAKVEPTPQEKPAVIFKTNSNAMIGKPARKLASDELADRARKDELETRLKSFGRWTDAERSEWWMLHSLEIGDKADRLVRRNKVSDAIFLVLKEIAINALGQARAREKLEARVLALEPKPRVRVQAGRQVIA